jgi:cytochrome b561
MQEDGVGIMRLVIAILMIIIFPDESDESSGKFSSTQLSPTAAATAHFSLLLFAQPLAGWLVSWLVGEEIRFSCKTLEPNSS